MSKHNRRRHRHPARHIQTANFDLPILADPNDGPTSFQRRRPRASNELSAIHWRNRFLAWKRREERQKEEKQRLEMEKRRIFGGNSEDGEESDELCPRMLDYYTRLDYLNELEMAPS